MIDSFEAVEFYVTSVAKKVLVVGILQRKHLAEIGCRSTESGPQ